MAPDPVGLAPGAWRSACAATGRVKWSQNHAGAAIRRWLPALMLAAATHGAMAAQPPLMLGTANPPSTFQNGERADGFCVELAGLIYQRLYAATPGTAPGVVHIVPWLRALTRAQSEPNVLLLGIARTPVREQTMHFIGPVFGGFSAAYALKERAAQLRAAGGTLRAGARRGTAFVDIAQRHGYLVSDQPANAESAARMLMMGRFDVWIDTSDQVPGALRDAGMAQDQVERLVDLDSMATYFAFSAGTPEATLQAWEDALRALKQDGTFQQLFRKWRPDRVPPGGVRRSIPTGLALDVSAH